MSRRVLLTAVTAALLSGGLPAAWVAPAGTRAAGPSAPATGARQAPAGGGGAQDARAPETSQAPAQAQGQAPGQAQTRQTPQAPPATPIPPVTFRTEINYVEVDATVLDRNGNVVRGLTRDDFELLEEGRPQEIALFSFVDLPVERPEQPLFTNRPIEPDVLTNERPFDGRLYVMVLDDLHTAPLRSMMVRAAAREFIRNHLGANDRAAVVHISGRADAAQEFTSNKRLLTEAVDKFMGQKLRSAVLNAIEEERQTRGIRREDEAIRDPEAQQRAYYARSMLGSLRSLAQWLDGIRGRRKSIVLFSEGIDYDIYDVFNNSEATTIREAASEAVAAATRSNVTIYSVDPRGLSALGSDIIDISSLPEDPNLRMNETGPVLGPTGLFDELRIAQDSLRTLSEETGGFAVVNQNDYGTAFGRLVKDNSSYYVLGYYPTNPRRDGRFRKLEVKVKRPGLEVRARKGYVAPKGDTPAAATTTEAREGTSEALRTLLNSPLPESGLPMALAVAPFKGADNKASVLLTVQLAGNRFRFTEKDGAFLDDLELSMIAVDQKGKVEGGDRSTVELKLRPESRQLVERAGFRVLRRIDLPPGRYQVRLAGRTANAGAAGSVHYDLEVPDFGKQPFSMSGLVLASAHASIVRTAQPDEQLKDVLPGPPTTMRDFLVTDTIAVLAEVYDNERRPHGVDIAATLTSDEGRVVFKTEEERRSEELQGARGGFVFQTQVPLKEIPPGRYLLRVEARSRLESDTPVARETLITVHALPERPAARPTAGGTGTAPAGKAVVPVVRGGQSGVDEPREVVARTEEEWQALWKTLPLKRDAPKVSFANTMVVAVFLGSRPSSGYSVEIVDVKRDGDTLLVEYVEREPAANVMTAAVMTSPYAVAGVPMHAGPVKFVKVEAPAGGVR